MAVKQTVCTRHVCDYTWRLSATEEIDKYEYNTLLNCVIDIVSVEEY